MSPLPVFASGSNSVHGSVVPIAQTTLTSSGDVAFTNIPTTYQDLFLVITSATTITYAIYAGLYMGVNNTYGAGGYSNVEFYTSGTVAQSSIANNTNYFQSLGFLPAPAWMGNPLKGDMHIHFLNYANTTNYKSILYQCAADMQGLGGTSIGVGTWRNTAAIVQMYITAAGASIAGDTFTLYGVRSVNQ